jgi:hypothetical protein
VVQLLRLGKVSCHGWRWTREVLARLDWPVTVGGFICTKVGEELHVKDVVTRGGAEPRDAAVGGGRRRAAAADAAQLALTDCMSPQGRLTMAGGCNSGGGDRMLDLMKQALQWSPRSRQWEALHCPTWRRSGAVWRWWRWPMAAR